MFWCQKKSFLKCSDLDPATSGAESGFTGAGSGNFRVWIRFCRIKIRGNPDLDPDPDPAISGSGSVLAVSRSGLRFKRHGHGSVQALVWRHHGKGFWFEVTVQTDGVLTYFGVVFHVLLQTKMADFYIKAAKVIQIYTLCVQLLCRAFQQSLYLFCCVYVIAKAHTISHRNESKQQLSALSL